MFHGIRVDEVKLLCQRLFRGSESGEYRIVDMKSMFFELTVNVVMRMIAGKRYYGENVSGSEDARRFKAIVTETLQLSAATNLVDFLPFVKSAGLNKTEKRLLILRAKRDKFMQELIEEHRRLRCDSVSEQRSRTMIDVLISLQETEPEYYTDPIIRGMMQVLLIAGSDTSSATMEWALSSLLNNPEILVQAQSEIDTNVGQSRLIEESDLTELPYLHGIIKETLRMYPAAPLLVPHESSEECTIGGFKVPRGTMLLVNSWAIQNDPRIWEEPSKFKPERFREMAGKSDKYMLLPFGTGRRVCPGEGLAMRLVGLALGSLIQCFEWVRTGGELVDMSEGTGLTMPRAQPLLAMCRPRPAMVTLLSQL